MLGLSRSVKSPETLLVFIIAADGMKSTRTDEKCLHNTGSGNKNNLEKKAYFNFKSWKCSLGQSRCKAVVATLNPEGFRWCHVSSPLKEGIFPYRARDALSGPYQEPSSQKPLDHPLPALPIHGIQRGRSQDAEIGIDVSGWYLYQLQDFLGI